MTRTREFVIYARPRLERVAGKWHEVREDERVRVMARAEGYAMVRKSGAMPFVVPERDIRPE